MLTSTFFEFFDCFLADGMSESGLSGDVILFLSGTIRLTAAYWLSTVTFGLPASLSGEADRSGVKGVIESVGPYAAYSEKSSYKSIRLIAPIGSILLDVIDMI